MSTPTTENTTEETRPVVKHNERCFNQFTKFCKEEKLKKVNEEAISSFIKACAGGWPNDKPKKETSLNIKYRGIINHLKATGKKAELKKGFVKECLAE